MALIDCKDAAVYIQGLVIHMVDHRASATLYKGNLSSTRSVGPAVSGNQKEVTIKPKLVEVKQQNVTL